MVLIPMAFLGFQKVPEMVQQAFTKLFPQVSSVSWERESATEWEGKFKLRGVKYAAVFLEDGSWVETEHEIGENDIPAKVIRAVEKAYPGYAIDEVEKLETKNGIAYELEIEKGKEEIEIILDTNRKIPNRGTDNEEEEK
jgi:hypothetical protein